MHGKFRLLSPGKASSHSTALPILGWVFSCVQCFHVSVIHQTLTWTTGYLTCVTFLCMRRHMGVGHTDNKSAHVDSEKLSQNVIVLLMGFEPLVMESIGSDTVPIEPPLPYSRFKKWEPLIALGSHQGSS